MLHQCHKSYPKLILETSDQWYTDTSTTKLRSWQSITAQLFRVTAGPSMETRTEAAMLCLLSWGYIPIELKGTYFRIETHRIGLTAWYPQSSTQRAVHHFWDIGHSCDIHWCRFKGANCYACNKPQHW